MALFTPTAYWGSAETGPAPPFDPSFLGASLGSRLSTSAGSIGSSTNITSVTDLGSSGGYNWIVNGGTGTSYATRTGNYSGLSYNGSNSTIATFDGGSDYWRTNSSVATHDSSGNSYVVQLSYVYNSSQKNDSIYSISGNSDFQVSSNSAGTTLNQIDMDGLSSTTQLGWYSDNGTTRNYTFQWNIWAFVFNKTGNQIFGRINGYPLCNTVTYSISLTSGFVRLATNRLANRRIQMLLAENLIIKDRPGTGSNTSIDTLEKVEGWLAWTYGLEGRLNPSHPYRAAAPRSGN